MAIEVQMPQMGESVVEGTIAKWLVKEGDIVTEDQPLVEISTDKVDTEIPSPGAGRIAKLVADEGQTLPVGAVIALIEQTGKSDGVAPQQAKPPAPQRVERARPTPPEAAPVAIAAEPKLTAAPKAPVSAPAELEELAGAASAAPALQGEGEHRRYSPVVMRMAAEHGLDIERIP